MQKFNILPHFQRARNAPVYSSIVIFSSCVDEAIDALEWINYKKKSQLYQRVLEIDYLKMTPDPYNLGFIVETRTDPTS
jgi:hypothetical protein